MLQNQKHDMQYGFKERRQFVSQNVPFESDMREITTASHGKKRFWSSEKGFLNASNDC